MKQAVSVPHGRQRVLNPGRTRRRRIPGLASIGLGAITALVYAYLFLPIAVMAIMSFSTNRFAVFPIPGMTLEWYTAIFENDQVIQGFKNSLIVALFTVLISVTLGVLASLALLRHRFRGQRLFNPLLVLPMMTPRVILAVALLLFFVEIGVRLSLLTVVIGHVIMTLPFTTLIITARLQSLDPLLDEAAWDLGASWFATLRLITLPLLLPAIIAAALITFTISFDDVIVSFFNIGTGATLPVVLWAQIQYGYTQELNAIGTLIMILTVATVLGFLYFQNHREGR